MAMKRHAIVFQHLCFEDLGSFHDVLRDHRYEVRTVQVGFDDLGRIAQEEADLAIVLGGPISSNDERSFAFLRREREILRSRLSLDLPCLGLGLGAQLMARALGASVGPMPEKEIGWSALVLHAPLRDNPLALLDGASVLHWHGEQYSLPEGARPLASTSQCNEQAFAWRKNGLALQFHPEVTALGLERWYIGHAVELSTAAVDVAALRRESAVHAPALKKRAQAFFDAWLSRLVH
jgi:GMP synthase (glutamine-hydrolysing)